MSILVWKSWALEKESFRNKTVLRKMKTKIVRAKQDLLEYRDSFYGSATNHLGAGIWVGWSVSTQISKQAIFV